MEPMELKAMRYAAQTIARWTRDYGREAARSMVLVDLSGVYSTPPPVFRDAFRTAFGR
jgi:hypothetical protein